MGFQSSRFLYPSNPVRRRLQLANEQVARANAQATENKTTALPEAFVAHPVKNAELAANPIVSRKT